jgi:hypothetical protein
MPKTIEARRGRHLAQASGFVTSTAADKSEFISPQFELQLRWLARRIGLRPERARLVAEIAFPQREART